MSFPPAKEKTPAEAGVKVGDRTLAGASALYRFGDLEPQGQGCLKPNPLALDLQPMAYSRHTWTQACGGCGKTGVLSCEWDVGVQRWLRVSYPYFVGDDNQVHCRCEDLFARLKPQREAG